VQTHPGTVYRFGPFEVNAASGELFKNGRRVKLQEQPYRLLLVLLENSGEVLSREELRSRLWPDDTFVDFDGSLRVAVRKLREALGDDAESPRYVETIPKRGYRFLGSAARLAELPSPATAAVVAENVAPSKSVAEVGEGLRTAQFHTSRWVLSVIVALLIIGTAVWLRLHQPGKALALTEKDTIVLADFENSTGDSVFDGTLRQGLAVELEQSPFLTLIPDQRIQQTLRLMGQAPDARLTPQIAHDLCQRTQSAAYLTGSIASLGRQYVLGLKAVSCTTGDVLAEEQETASSKEKLLGALDRAANKLREKLGESLNTVEKFDTPLEQATTPSLEALQAYTLGRRTQGGRDESIPFYQRAIQYDPNFAIAYAALGSIYWGDGETLLGEQSVRKAYELRSSVSERERFYIESTYFHYVTGDLEKSRRIYNIWAQTYPRDSTPRIGLWLLYFQEGQYEAALPHLREAIRLAPWKSSLFRNLVYNLICLNRLQEARKVAQQAIADRLDSPDLHLGLYRLAFLEDDALDMARQAELVVGKGHSEAEMFELRALTAAYSGHLKESRNLSRQAVESAMRAEEREFATELEARAALRGARFGNLSEVRLHAKPVLGVPTGRKAQYVAALSFAIAGDSARAQLLADDLAKRYPDDTLVQFVFLPAIRAQIALNRHDPSKAINLLQPGAPYELAQGWLGFLGLAYMQGEAYLMAHQGNEAAVEFQKILGHRGIVANSPTGALAHLQLGRAYATSGEQDKAKIEYLEFLSLWKDADPDIPILKQAKAEYAKLQ